MKASAGKGRNPKEGHSYFYLYKENTGFLSHGVYKENTGFLSCRKSLYTLDSSKAYLFSTAGLDCVDDHNKSYKKSWDSVTFDSDIKIVECLNTVKDFLDGKARKPKYGRRYAYWYENEGFLSQHSRPLCDFDLLEAGLSSDEKRMLELLKIIFSDRHTLDSSEACLDTAENIMLCWNIELESILRGDVDWNMMVRIWNPLKYMKYNLG